MALVKILLAPPNFLLMDEPTNHLDIPSCEILEEGLKRFTGTLVMITHDRRLMNTVCNAILEIRDGNAEHYFGNYEDYQYKKKLMENSEEIEPLPLIAPAVTKINETSSVESRKDRKRKEAQKRITLSRRQAPIKAEIAAIEKQMERHELRLRKKNKKFSQEVKRLEARWRNCKHNSRRPKTGFLSN